MFAAAEFRSGRFRWIALLAVAAFGMASERAAQAALPHSSAAATRFSVDARRAQQPPNNGPNTNPNAPPDKIPRGAGAGTDAGGQNNSGGAIIESSKNYVFEYGIVLVLVAAAVGAVCKSSHRV